MFSANFVKFRKNLKNYFGKISIHGLSNMFRSINRFEIIFWLIILNVGIYYLYILLYSNIIEFYNQPILKTIDSTVYPVSLVPFPAVTVCNFNVVFKSKAAKIEKLLVENGIEKDVAKSFFAKLSLLRSPEYIETKKYEKVYQVLQENGYTSNRKFMQDVAQPCSSLLRYCSWVGREVNCTSIFTESKGDVGLCCSFNSNLYSVHENSSLRPTYFTTAGSHLGLYLELDLAVEEYVSAAYNITSLLVYVHEANAYPDDSSFFGLIEKGREVSLKITPDVFEAEPLVQNVKINKRRCLFDEEGYKFYNQNYSFANCMQLCKSYAVGNYCNCVPDYYPDTDLWRSCTLLDVPCLKQNIDKYTSLHMELNVLEHEKDDKITCDCLPSCSGVQYSGVIDSLYYKKSNNEHLSNISGVRIYFENNWCFKYTTSRSMKRESLIALIGGFFSLCLGGSLLSIVELFYYLFKSFFVKYETNNTTHHYPQLYWSELNLYKQKKVAPKRVVMYNTFFNDFVN